jgi:hypothetical protein
MKTLEQMQTEYVARYVADVRRSPTSYKARVIADPVGSARAIIAGLDANDMREMLRCQREEMRAVERYA